MSAQQIRGSVALVTGANRGIGKAIVEELLSRGASKVYAAARNPASLEGLVKEHGDRVVPIALDVTDADRVARLAAETPDVTLVVNNAGAVGTRLGAQVTDPDVLEGARLEMEVNYFGPLHVTQALAPVLGRNGGGTLVNVASVVALTAFPMVGTYSASKAAVRSLTQSSRAYLASQGTTVIGVYPGPVDTEMARDIPHDKVSASSVAEEIADAIESGQLEVYPDPYAAGLGRQFESSPSELERQISGPGVAAAA